MTSASELFYTRRSRSGRSDPKSGFESSLEPSFHHHNSVRRQNHACAPSLSSHHSPRSSAHSEHSSMRFSQGRSLVQSTSGGEGDARRSSSRPVLSPTERLPGAVLLARARLLERLRGVSIPANRRSNQARAGADHREHIFGDEFRLVDAGDWGTDDSAEMSSRDLPSADFMFVRERRERVQLLHERNKKLPGLTRAVLDSLQREVFCETGVDTHESRDCSICLEGFGEGDELVRLSCGHRFHSACLLPWVRTCGDCPYCRQGICLNR